MVINYIDRFLFPKQAPLQLFNWYLKQALFTLSNPLSLSGGYWQYKLN